MSGRIKVGVIGAGAISASYLSNMTAFPDLDVVIVGDLDTGRAADRAAEFSVPRSGTTEDVLASDAEIVLNLTIPAAHAEISLRILEAGKHVWSEKPVAVSRTEAAAVVARADELGLRVGVAPDTVLGPGMQTALRIIQRGDIGVPLSAHTMMQTAGPQRGHPNPEFLFQPGAGPLFDFGPYYFTALALTFGPAAQVASVGSRATKTRVIGSGPRAGTEFDVNVDTNVGVLTSFESGQTSMSTLSFDAQLQRMGFFEIYGSEGTLAITDPNMFTGHIRLAYAPEPGPPDPDFQIDWAELPIEGTLTGRGLGVLDLARSIREERPHRASAELAAHVLDTLVAVQESMETRRFVDVTSTFTVVDPLPADFDPFAATL